MELLGFRTIICDSGAALRALEEEGLSPDCRVLTASAFLHHSLGDRSEFLRDRVNAQTLADILAIRPELQHRMLAGARKVPVIEDFAEVAALMLLTSIDLLILAACLKQADCDEPRLIVQTKTGNARLDRGCNGPWPSLLASNKNVMVHEVDVQVDTVGANNESTRWFDRLRVAGWRRAAFRALSAFGPRFPGRSKREALILSENELLHETAFALAMRGWALRKVHVTAKMVPLTEAETAALETLCHDVLTPYCTRWLIETVRGPSIATITERVLSAVRDQKAAATGFEQILSRLPPARSRVIVSNFPAKPTILGPWKVARRYGIPLFGFQHGVSSEICNMQDATIATKEVMCSDRSYTFNEQASMVANAISGRHGLSVPVGMPGDMRRMRTSVASKRLATIAFVSTAVYGGYWNRLLYGTRNDSGMLAFELAMIRDVLAGLRHDVLYKRYPSIRLLDPDPAVEEANAATNIRVYSDHVDMRYLMGCCDVLVTARATSTLSWCLMSDRPLVHIDIQDDMRLRDDAHAAFEQSLFLFSTAKSDWASSVRAFLDRPIAQIRTEWLAKADARRDLVHRYFDMGGPAGARAARDITAVVSRGSAGNLVVAAAS